MSFPAHYSRLALALSAALVSGSTFANATAATSADDSTIEHIQVTGEKQQYKVQTTTTATKTNTLLRDIPQAITVVTEQQMADQSMQSMADVVRYVPGVQMSQGEGHRDAPVFRGTISTADFFINGVRDDVQYLRDLYNAERIEVLKGPSGMIFGRGGAGGLVNRVSKQANWSASGSADLSYSTQQQARLAADYNHVVNQDLALRLTGMYEDSDSFRDFYYVERSGVNPTLTYKLAEQTTLALSYEHFDDERLTDRGGPSDPRTNKPLPTRRSLFIGSPTNSISTATVDAVGATLSHEFHNGVTLVNQTRYADYDKYYDNVFAGAFNPTSNQVALSAYSSATARKNLINQTDLTFELNTGAIRHKLLAGAEYSKQETDNQRLTGYFSTIGANTTSINVPISMPLYQGVISFRAAGSDADNQGEAVAKAVYLQDQLELSEQWHAVLGARYDQFSVDLHNNRNNTDLHSDDDLVSPRAGLIYKPITDVSAYINYSKSYVPRAGEQLAGLSATNAALEPEAFVNREVGLKWDLSSQLAVTAALYQLDRTNVAVTDPTDPTKLLLVDGQNVQGVELELQGQVIEGWDFVAGYANQDAEVEAPAADRGKTLPQVPKQKLSMWHKYQFNDQWGVGLGLTSQSASFIALDNKITLPGFARWDAAVYYKPLPDVRVQLNVENLTDKHYAASAHNNNNIMPGSPANARLSVSYKF